MFSITGVLLTKISLNQKFKRKNVSLSRFFGVLFWYFGDAAKRFMKQSSGLVTLLLLVVLIGGFVAAGYLL